MLQDIKKLLKKNGKLFILDILSDEVTRTLACKFHLTRKEFLNAMTSNGFELVFESEVLHDDFKCFEFKVSEKF